MPLWAGCLRWQEWWTECSTTPPEPSEKRLTWERPHDHQNNYSNSHIIHLFWDSIQVMAASLCGGIYSKLSTVITPGDNAVSLYGFYLQTASSCTVLTWTAQHMVQITAAVTVQLNKKSTPCTPQGWAKIYARISSHPKYLSKRHYRTICTTVKKKVEKRCQTWMYNNSKGERGRETW